MSKSRLERTFEQDKTAKDNIRSYRSCTRAGGSASQVFDQSSTSPEATEDNACMIEEMLDYGLQELEQRRFSVSTSANAAGNAKTISIKEGRGMENYEEKKLLLYGKALEETVELNPAFSSLFLRVKDGIEDCFKNISAKKNQLFEENRGLKKELAAMRSEKEKLEKKTKEMAKEKVDAQTLVAEQENCIKKMKKQLVSGAEETVKYKERAIA